MGLYLLRYLARRAHSENTNADNITRGVLETLVGTLQAIKMQSNRSQTPSQPVPPINDIRKLMTLLTLHRSITGRMSGNGRQPLSIFKKSSEDSVN